MTVYNITTSIGGDLSLDITSTDTEILLVGGAGNGLPLANFFMDLTDGTAGVGGTLATKERIYVATRTADLLSGCVRGYDSSLDGMPARDWAAGTHCWQLISASYLRKMLQRDELPYLTNEQRLKLCPIGTELRYVPAMHGGVSFATWLASHTDWADIKTAITGIDGRVSAVTDATNTQGTTRGSADAVVVSHNHSQSAAAIDVTIIDPTHSHAVGGFVASATTTWTPESLAGAVEGIVSTSSTATGITATATMTGGTISAAGVTGVNANYQPTIFNDYAIKIS